MIPIQTSTSSPSSQAQIASLELFKTQHIAQQLGLAQKKHDDISLSPLGELASATGLDLSQSTMRSAASGYYFDFNFEDTCIQSLNASGFMDMQHQKMEMDFFFVVDETMFNPNGNSNRQFKFSLHISLEQFRSSNANISTRKEDIYDFIQRIVKKIADYAASKDQELVDLFLDPEDIQEIAGLDGGKVLKDIAALIGIIHTTNQILNRDKEDVAIYIPRKQETLLNWTETESKNLEISIQVEELLTKSTQKESESEIPENDPDPEFPFDQAA
jgi:hypothetical protein